MTADLELAASGPLAIAMRNERDALTDHADPWGQADALATRWLRSFANPGTRDQYRMIYQSWRDWCDELGVTPIAADRSDVETYARALETVGNPASRTPRPMAVASVLRHLSGVSSYLDRAVYEELTARNPAAVVRREKAPKESHQPYLSPAQIGALLAAADAEGPRSAALVALPVFGCLRISEALGIDMEDFTEEDGHRFVLVTRKGGQRQRIPMPPPLLRRVTSAAGIRMEGPLFATSSGRRMDRVAAWKTIRRMGRVAKLPFEIGPHTLRHAYLTRGLELGIPLADLQDAAGHADPRTTKRYDRRQFDADRHPSYAIALDLAGSLG